MKTLIPIRGWNDGYSALKRHLERVRGAVESDICGGDWERWPRTTGGDVLVIASFLALPFEHSVQRHNTLGAGNRWLACLDDMFRWAVANPEGEYRENRRFWGEVLRVCVHLSQQDAPLPPQAVWDELLQDLSCTHRNGVPKEVPFGPFAGIGSYKDLYVAQVLSLQRSRGMDRMEPEAGMTGGTKNIPRSTNDDVKQLVAFWSRQLDSVQKIIGHEAVADRWSATVREVEQLTKDANPTAVYPKNNAFWRALNTVSTQVSVADQAPTRAERIVDSIKEGVSSLPDTAKAVASGIGSAATAAAGGVGRVAGGLFGGLLSAFGWPLAIAGGVGVGAVLLLRGRNSAAPEKR
jgi:hypothetical protein